MKKVLFVSHVVKLHMALFHIPYIKWFYEQGWKVDVAARNDYDNPEDCNIPYVNCYYDLPFERSPLRLNNIKAYSQLKRIIKKENYDIIHCHTPVGGVVTRLAARHSRKKGTTVIYTAHGFHFYKGAPKLNWLVFYPIEKFCSRFTDLLITMNREDYQISKKFNAKRIELVNGVGIDLSRFNPYISDDQKKEVRETLGYKEDDILGINIGNLIKRKNQTVLLDAVPYISDSKFKLLICGDGEEERNLQMQINRLNINDRVSLLGFRSDISTLLKCADIFLFSSTQEGLAVSVMEAMACGLPIVASRIRGNVDLIDEGNGDYLVNANNPKEYADAVNQLLSDNTLLQKAREYNLHKIIDYSIDSVLNSVVNMYKDYMKET